ncbi:MAG: alkaline phosphatase family protein [Isosphaeraceae bacterium]
MYRKVIAIGLDGLEPTIVEAMLARGELPNLAKLVPPEGLARVATTTPAQTPVAWSTFATGVNPGGHGVFDFLRRDPRTYLPDSGLNRYEQKNPLLPPRAVNQRQGTPIWQHLSSAGIGSTVLRCPCTYPPDRLRGALLSGMGVPDLRGGFGTSTFYTTDTTVQPRESEHVVHLSSDGQGTISTHLIGPRHPRTRADAHFEIGLRVDRERQRVLVRSDGSPSELEVKLGRWSDWLRVKFRLGPLQAAWGVVRFHLVRLGPEVELYASPVNFDPATPLFPISEPGDYAKRLSQDLGIFHTTGMVEDHNGLVNERIDEAAFLDQCMTAWREREAMLLHELGRFREGFFYCLFDTPDRVQHMMWRFREPDHPANRLAGRELGTGPTEPFRHAVEDHYREADRIVGEVLSQVDDRTLLVVLSDHGFSSFQRGFHVNQWLHDQGLLALESGVEPGHAAGDFLRHVDWARTKAYCMGLSGLYLNLRGREAKGTVRPEDAENLAAEIARSLGGLKDPARGATAIRGVLRREQVYRGPFVADAPDLLINYAPGYRVSWSSSLGGIAAGDLFEDNTRKWAGDHIIDPALVPGVLMMNRPFRPDGARLVDLAPTILQALGVPAAPGLEGTSLLA